MAVDRFIEWTLRMTKAPVYRTHSFYNSCLLQNRENSSNELSSSLQRSRILVAIHVCFMIIFPLICLVLLHPVLKLRGRRKKKLQVMNIMHVPKNSHYVFKIYSIQILIDIDMCNVYIWGCVPSGKLTQYAKPPCLIVKSL